MLYTTLTYLLLPFAFLRLYIRGKKLPAYRLRWKERMGIVPFKLKNCIWVHSVSVGETIAAEPLVRKLQRSHPNRDILITTMTPSGSDLVKTIYGDTVKHCYLPYDVPLFIHKLLKSVQPKILIIMETELWPNLLRICHDKKIPSILANGRLSERSFNRYLKFKKTSAAMMKNIRFITAQTKIEALRFIKLGLNQEKISITGSIKFDLKIPDDLEKKAEDMLILFNGRPTWIAASTHDGEEKYILAAHQQIIKKIPSALLILVPRHPNRFEQVKDICHKHDVKFISRSDKIKCTEQTSVFIGDSMGEMLTYYQATDIAFVGGSLVAIGGHNVLEPAALRKPTITGPYTTNFLHIVELMLDDSGIIQVNNAAELATNVIELLENETKRQELGENAFKIIKRNRGALDKIFSVIEKLFS